jgi:hypothetical protein
LANGLIEGLVETDSSAKDKTPDELDDMIQETLDNIEATRFETRMFEARLQRLKKFKNRRVQEAQAEIHR